MEIIISKEPENLIVMSEAENIVITAIEKVGQLYGEQNAEVSVTLTNNDYIQTLNKEYRGIDRPTDVLSFALNESEEPEVLGGNSVNVLGDIVISVERAEEQADEYGHSKEREIAFLTVHGMLHLLGYDHVEDEDREEMEKEQKFVMESLGIHR